MAAHGRRRDVEALGDLAVREAEPDQIEHLPLAARELLPGQLEHGTPAWAAVVELLYQATDEVARNRRFPLGCIREGVRKPGQVHILEQVPGRARVQGSEEVVRVARGGGH